MKKALFFLLFLPSLYCSAGAAYPYPDIIVFDFGGVVGEIDYNVYENKLQKTLGITNALAKKIIKKAGKSKSEAYWRSFQTRKGIKNPEQWASKIKLIRKESMRINPQIQEIINELKDEGYQVALLSNIPTGRANLIRKLGLYDPFSPAVLSCDINVSKPHKRAYEILLEKLGNVHPSRCFFIDDMKENVKAARRLGFHATQFKSPEKLRRELVQRNILPLKVIYELN